jgi:hypothetical protein
MGRLRSVGVIEGDEEGGQRGVEQDERRDEKS